MIMLTQKLYNIVKLLISCRDCWKVI